MINLASSLSRVIRSGAFSAIAIGSLLLATSAAHAGPTPPIANAGPDATYTASASGTIAVALNGTGSYDLDFGDSVTTYQWSNSFGSASGPQPTVTLAVGVHVVTLYVYDQDGNISDPDTATITVVAPVAGCPTITTPAKNKTVECDGLGDNAALLAWLNSHGGAVATSPNGPITWTNNYNPALFVYTDTDCAEGHVTVVFTATDPLGKKISTSATFFVVDTTPPTLSWYVEGQAVNDSNTYTLTTKALPITVQVVPTDICGGATLSKHSRTTLSGCASVSFCANTFTITSASVGSSIRFVAQGKDDCGNLSACEWVTIKVVQASTGNCYGKGDESCGSEDDDGHCYDRDDDDDHYYHHNGCARNKHW